MEKDFKKLYGLSSVKFRFANRKSGTLIKRFEQDEFNRTITGFEYDAYLISS